MSPINIEFATHVPDKSTTPIPSGMLLKISFIKD